MPELPEVETVRRTLAPLVGARVTEVWHSGLPLHLNRPVDIEAVRRASVGGTVEAVRRLGKYLLLDFAGRPAAVLVHLGMTGRLRLAHRADPPFPHTHVLWRLAPARAGRELRFSDPRRFGQVGVALRGREREHPALAGLGIDPLEDGLTGESLHALAKQSRQPLKTFLLDQRRIAGIGNIYASEALWLAGIRPSVRAHRLSRPRASALADAVRGVLDHALTHGGTSLRDFVSAAGNPGEFRDHLRVYDREGQRCARRGCDGTVVRQVTQGRATFYCPSCQR